MASDAPRLRRHRSSLRKMFSVSGDDRRAPPDHETFEDDAFARDSARRPRRAQTSSPGLLSLLRRRSPRLEQTTRKRTLQSGLGTPEGAPYIELSIECRDLTNRDVLKLGKSDPFVVMLVAHRDGRLRPHDYTETVRNTLHPKFVKCFDLPFGVGPDFEFALSFEVFDRDSYVDRNLHLPQLYRHDFIGLTSTDLSAVLKQEFQTLELPLTNPLRAVPPKTGSSTSILLSSLNTPTYGQARGPAAGFLLISAEKVVPTRRPHRYDFRLSFAAPVPAPPRRRPRLGPGRPFRGVFLVIARAAKHRRGFFTPVYRSEVVDGPALDLDPVRLLAEKLDGNNDARTVRFLLYGYRHNGDHVALGHFQTCVAKLKYDTDRGAVAARLVPEPGGFHGYQLQASLWLDNVSLVEGLSTFSMHVDDVAWKAADH